LLNELRKKALKGDLAHKPEQIVPHILKGRLAALNMRAQFPDPNFDNEEAKKILKYTINVIREIASERGDLGDVEEKMRQIWRDNNLNPLKEKLGDFDPFVKEEDAADTDKS